jgi:hypothetical protein
LKSTVNLFSNHPKIPLSSVNSGIEIEIKR